MDPILKIVNATVYEDGTKNYLGKVKEIELPKIAHIFTEHEALGLIQKLQLSTGMIEATEAKFTWTSFDADEWVKALTPGLARKLQVRANVQGHTADGMVSETPFVTQLTVQSKVADPGKLASGAATEMPEDFIVTYIKQTLGSRVLLELDVFKPIWTVDGKDMLKGFKASLGL